MAQNTRQANLLVQQDWTKIYQAFSNADFTSYDFETLRSSMIGYIKTYYPETFNDFLESSEYIALIDLIAYLGQSLAFRTDLNARENFIDTAQRRDSVLKLARMLSYNPQRTTSASGLLKFDSVKTTESILDSAGLNLSNVTVNWNDLTNDNWQEQFSSIINAALLSSQTLGKPGNTQVISGVKTDEYAISLNANTLPVAAFSTTIQGTPIQFEAVSATSIGQPYLYEADPTTSGKFNILQRSDNNGNGSNNTGFFLFFKQGTLSASDFTIANAIPNNYVPITTNNQNNSDNWLYQLDVNSKPTTKWDAVPAISGINVIYNQLSDKNLYQVNTQNNDQVNLVFGDGAFANIPSGAFRYYFRTSIGASYTIAPDDISSVQIAFSYTSKNNTTETLTVTASLRYSVTNASASQTLDSVRTSAPQQYYTQNRMITAEDYNIFPQTSFNSIQKIKVTNRTSSGVSLYLDAIDPTGSYSATNIVGKDGFLQANTVIGIDTFSFLNSADVYSAIYNDVLPIINSVEMINYYYSTYPRMTSPANVVFNQVTSSTSSSSGYLQIANATQQVGAGVGSPMQYVSAGASLLFVAPAGHYFTPQQALAVGSGTQTLYASVVGINSNGAYTSPSLVTVGTIVPNGAILQTIIPPYKNTLLSPLISTIVGQISALANFGLSFDQINQVWVNIPPSQISTSTSWLLKFTYNSGLYTIQSKTLQYVFGSAAQTYFYFDPTSNVYDSLTSTNIADTVTVLPINTTINASSAPSLGQSVAFNIYDTIVESDGFALPNQVLVKFPTTQMESVPDNPDLYTIVNGSLSERTSLYFDYQHNAPARNRIDPTPVNLMDAYVLTADYSTSYMQWLGDLTGLLSEPVPPTSSSLEIAYATLDNYKTVSDTLIFNPAIFKPLFGTKAVASLQARFQLVKNPASSVTDNDLKSQLIIAINKYFDISNWDFGDTFYFTELAAYLHAQLVPNLASVLIIPADSSMVFGNFFQINSNPWEIITSAATVNDIDVISAVTAAQLNLGNTLVGTF